MNNDAERAMRVDVLPPEIDGDTVTFRWTQDAPNPFQRHNQFSFRYDGLTLSELSPLVFYEVFLGLQLRVFAAYGRPITMRFPGAVSPWTIAFWTAFHKADLVTVEPTTATGSYEPWRRPPEGLPGPRAAAVFFGGGRESTTTTCILSEILGADEVLLIQYVGPLRPDQKLARRLEERQEALMLRPARELLGVATQVVHTDYQAGFLRAGYHVRPHLELYTVGALPALLAWGVSLATYCHGWTDYPIVRTPSGDVRFYRSTSRPEMLTTLTAHYRAALGLDLTMTNLALGLSGSMSMPILAARYPAALEQLVMCTLGDVDERWCYRCAKCISYGFYSVLAGFVDPRLDYDRLFGDSPYLRRMTDFALTGVELTDDGNASGIEFARTAYFHPIFHHVLASLDLKLLEGRIGAEAFSNLVIAKALFGNRPFPVFDMVPLHALRLLNNDIANHVGRIMALHRPTTETQRGMFPSGVEYDFDVRMPTRTEMLDHVRAAGQGGRVK